METINVDAKEVIEWVTQRRKLKPDWNQKLKALEHKAQSIVDEIQRKSLPELEDSFKGKQDQKVDFLWLKEIEEGLIKSKEGEEKNFFGQYKSQSIKDVQALIRLYEKEFLHFAGLAHSLVQLVTYDIPFCRKVTKSNQNTIKDLEYKMSSYESSIGNASRDILKLVAKYDPESSMCEDEIDNFNINSFIGSFTRSITSRIGIVEDKLAKLDIDEITDYYARFAAYNSEKLINPYQFKLIKTLRQHGDISVSDYHNDRTTQMDRTLNLAFYDKLLASKGYGDAQLISEDQQWEIEDLDNNAQSTQTHHNNNTKNTTPEIMDTIITNRETREEVIESLYEVI